MDEIKDISIFGPIIINFYSLVVIRYPLIEYKYKGKSIEKNYEQKSTWLKNIIMIS
jgi:hypothetical protein